MGFLGLRFSSQTPTSRPPLAAGSLGGMCSNKTHRAGSAERKTSTVDNHVDNSGFPPALPSKIKELTHCQN